MENKKLCKACGIEKELDEFLVRKRSEKGRHPRCKMCVKSDNYIEGCEAEKGSYRDVIGTKHITNEGLTVTIISGTDLKHLTVQFEDGSIVENIIFGNLKRGSLNHPNNRLVKGFNKEKEKVRQNKERKEKEIQERIGKEYTNRNGLKFKIINYKSHKDVDIEFENGIFLYHLNYQSIKKGYVSYGNEKTFIGIGYMGTKIYDKYYDYNHFSHSRWSNMIYRCYSKSTNKKQPTYKDIKVCEEWYNFQNYAHWCEENWKSWMDNTWHLDKDIICKNCGTYSPENCGFVPNEINVLFTKRQNHRGDCLIGTHKSSKNRWRATISKKGEVVYLGVFDNQKEAFEAYKVAKEEYIKEVADEWKNLISKEVYDAMYNYKVEITD
jgi:hypothetical protein